nr:aminoacyl-tRNA synthetase, class 1a, anticodon-binding [Tanacetum cinerariifolium]
MLVVPAGGDGADAAAAEDISEDGDGCVSSPKSNKAPPTTAATAAGGAEDSVALTDLSLKLDRCINRVTSLENELGVTKKVLSGAVLKLVSRVKRLEGILQQRNRRMMLSNSEGEEAAIKEQEIDLNDLHELASTSLGGDTTVEAAYTIYKASHDAHASTDASHDEDEVPDTTTMPFRHTRTKRRRLRKTFTSSPFKHFQENISAVEHTILTGAGIPTDAQIIPAGSTPIPTTGGVSAGSSMDPTGQAAAAAPTGKALMVEDFIPADLLTEQERVLKNLYDYPLEEDLAKKLQAEQEAEFARQQEELAQKDQAESVASPAAQGDDVNEDNMNERLAMLLMRKRRELAKQSRVKPMNKTQQRDFMRDFMKNQSASVYNQGWTMKQVPAASLQVPAGVLAAPSIATDVSVSAISTTTADVPPVTPDLAAVSAHAATEVHADESHPNDNKTASEQVSAEHIVNVSTTVAFTSGVSHATPSSSSKCRKQIAKKRVTPIVDVAADALIKFDSAKEHTKHFTSLRELLHMVEKNDLRRLLGDSLADEDAHAFWRDQESWRIRNWHLYPLPHVHVLETVDGRVIYMFVDVSYPLSEATLERMLRHGLKVPKLLIGGDLTMAEQLVRFIKVVLLNA